MNDLYPLPPIPTADALALQELMPGHFLLTPDQLQASRDVSVAIRYLVVAHAPDGISPDTITRAVHDACIAVRDALTEALNNRADQGT